MFLNIFFNKKIFGNIFPVLFRRHNRLNKISCAVGATLEVGSENTPNF